MSDIDTVVVDSLKVLDPDGRLEKRTLIRSRGAFALAAGRERALDPGMIKRLALAQPPGIEQRFDHLVGGCRPHASASALSGNR